jgi:hypothetical protein
LVRDAVAVSGAVVVASALVVSAAVLAAAEDPDAAAGLLPPNSLIRVLNSLSSVLGDVVPDDAASAEVPSLAAGVAPLSDAEVLSSVPELAFVPEPAVSWVWRDCRLTRSVWIWSESWDKGDAVLDWPAAAVPPLAVADWLVSAAGCLASKRESQGGVVCELELRAPIDMVADSPSSPATARA